MPWTQLDPRVICLRNRKGEFSRPLFLNKQRNPLFFLAILNQMLIAVIII